MLLRLGIIEVHRSGNAHIVCAIHRCQISSGDQYGATLAAVHTGSDHAVTSRRSASQASEPSKPQGRKGRLCDSIWVWSLSAVKITSTDPDIDEVLNSLAKNEPSTASNGPTQYHRLACTPVANDPRRNKLVMFRPSGITDEDRRHALQTPWELHDTDDTRVCQVATEVVDAHFVIKLSLE